MQLFTDRCTGCGYCILVCPNEALKSNGWTEIIPANCINCNLCVYACPNDCFKPEPEFPLKPYRPRLKEAYDVVIIGSGLGGLMAGAALAQRGYAVAVFEKLGFPGGRYTELTYKGAVVTTGAWTNLGPKSHIGHFLTDIGIELDYISLHDRGLTEQYSLHFPDGRYYPSLFALLTPTVRKAWLKAITKGHDLLQAPYGARSDYAKRKRYTKRYTDSYANTEQATQSQQHGADESLSASCLENISTADYIAQFSSDPNLLAAVDAITAVATGLNSKQVPAAEYIQITLAGREAGRDFAMPKGGVRAIIKALVTTLRQAGGELFVRSPVAQILLEPIPSSSNFTAVGLKLADGRAVHSQVVIHNGGPGRFTQLIGPHNLPPDYLARLNNLSRVECGAFFGATREPLFTGPPITMTPQCRRIVGIFSPTLLDPNLSKNSLHLFDAFFPMYNGDRVAELERVQADLRNLFPHFDEVVEWTVPMFFTGTWPGTESGQTFGQTGDHRLDPATPIKNCYLVGMDVQGSGVAGDLIPLGVRRMLELIKKQAENYVL